MRTDVVIVGAGASGLACARELQRRGLDVCVLEARDRIGGRIHTLHDFADEPFELGAVFVHGRGAVVIDIAEEAGLVVERPSWPMGGESFVAMDGQLRPPEDLEGWWSLEAEVASFGGPDRPLEKVLVEKAWPPGRRALAAELFAQFWCADPRLLSVEGVARVETAWASGPENLIVRDGYDRIAEHLGSGLHLELEAVVTSVAWRSGSVTVGTADGRTYEADAAVVSVPPTTVAAGRPRFDPPLPQRKSAAARAIPLGPVVRVVAALAEPAPSGGSFVNVGAEGGFWRIWPGERLLSVWIGGPSAAHFSAVDPLSIALRANIAFPWLERRSISEVRCADWGMDPFSLGGYSYPRAGALDAPYEWAEPLEKTLFFCGEATCGDVHPATVHGAIESGLRAADEAASACERTK